MIPFRARHLLEIKPDADAEMQRLALLAQHGPAYTGFLMGKAVGAAGVYITGDVGEAWTLFNPAIKAFPLFLHKTVKRLLSEVAQTVPEIYAICSDDGEWLRRLGFESVKQSEKPKTYQPLPDNQTLFVRRSWRS